MKYYAVTDDPNELMHWGIKGMRWGIRRTDAQLGHPRHAGNRSRKPRSEAYKKASEKLSSGMRNGINKVKTKWKTYNSPAAKEERFMKKAMQQARTGTLKYGKLTDDQVRRVTDRLALERNARQLGNTENPKYAKRLKMAIGQGIITGIGQGTASYINERFRGRGATTAEIKRDKRMSKYESNQRIQERKAKNKVNQEYYEEAARRGYTPRLFDDFTDSTRAKQLSAWKDRDAMEAERTKRQNAYYDTYVRTAAANRAKNRVPDRHANNNNNSDNNNSNNNNNGNRSQQPITININTNARRRSLNATTALRPTSNQLRRRRGRRGN